MLRLAMRFHLHNRLLVFVTATIAFVQYTNAAGLQFDRISSLNGLLPRTTEHYQIDSTVGLNGAYYQFRVKSAHGDYEVESIKNVLKVCHEITAIEGYKANDEGGEVWKGLSGSVKNLGSGAKTIVTKPNQARKAIGRSLSKTGRWVGRLFKRDRDEKSSTGEDRDQAAGGKYYGKRARILAYDLKLDVYTENQFARELMHAAAKREAIGRVVITGGLLATAVPGLYVTLYGALTPDSIDADTELLIRDNLPSELRFQLLRKYTRSHKLDKRKDAKRIAAYRKFLENPNFSPREIAYIANSLKRFSAAANLSTAIAQLGAIDNVADAMFIAGQYELLDVLHKRQSPIKKLLLLGNKIGAMNEAGNIVVPSTLDVATSSADLKNLRRQILQAKSANQAGTATLYTIGSPTLSFANESSKAGLSIRGNLLQLPEFKAKKAEDK